MADKVGSQVSLHLDFESTPEAVIVLQDRHIRYANPEARSLFGFPADQLESVDPMSFLHSSERAGLLERQTRILRGEPGISDNTFRVRVAKGKIHHIKSHSVRVRLDGSAATLHFLHPIISILPESDPSKVTEASFRFLTETASDVLWALDAKTRRFLYISPAVMTLRGYTADEALAQTLEESLSPDSAQVVSELIARSLDEYKRNPKQDIRQVVEIQQPCKDGSLVWVEASTHCRVNAEGRIEIVGISRNIGERKKTEQDLIHRSYHDELTGLYNRHYMNSRISEEIERSERYDVPLSMALFDLDHFKALNDTWGHDAGDEQLKMIARAVSAVVRDSDILVRMGGEEFIAVFPQTGEAGAGIAAEKMRKSIESCVNPMSHVVTASFGVAERSKAESYKSWLRRLDNALYRAKDSGRNRVVEASRLRSPFFMPKQFEWRSKWECGNALIDTDHKDLMAITNDLTQRLAADPLSEQAVAVLDELLNRVDRHFHEEERILAFFGYPELSNHAEIHSSLLAKAIQLKEKYLNGAIGVEEVFGLLIDEVVVGHMLTSDILFYPYLRKWLDRH